MDMFEIDGLHVGTYVRHAVGVGEDRKERSRGLLLAACRPAYGERFDYQADIKGKRQCSSKNLAVRKEETEDVDALWKNG